MRRFIKNSDADLRVMIVPAAARLMAGGGCSGLNNFTPQGRAACG